MAKHYFDHPEVGGYKYLALRAPNDTWNGFYDDYVYPLIANLIEQQVVLNDVDSDKVFIMGYSHGGYGAYAIGPKIAPTISRRFTPRRARRPMAKPRPSRCATRLSPLGSAKKIWPTTVYRATRSSLTRSSNCAANAPIFYPVTVSVKMGFEHSNLQDRDLIPAMYPNIRNPVPRELNWLQTDGVIRDFYWLHADNPAKQKRIDASCLGNTVAVAATPDVKAASVYLDSRLVDFSKPVNFKVNGQSFSRKLSPSFQTLCDTMIERKDAELAFSARVDLPLSK